MLGDKQNGCQPNVGLHPRCPNPLCERRANEYRLSLFRHTDEAAKSRRLPRGWLDIGSQAMLQLLPQCGSRAATEPRECEALACFRVAEYSGGIFWCRLFSRKKRHNTRWIERCVRTDGSRGDGADTLVCGRGNPSPTVVVGVYLPPLR